MRLYRYNFIMIWIVLALLQSLRRSSHSQSWFVKFMVSEFASCWWPSYTGNYNMYEVHQHEANSDTINESVTTQTYWLSDHLFPQGRAEEVQAATEFEAFGAALNVDSDAQFNNLSRDFGAVLYHAYRHGQVSAMVGFTILWRSPRLVHDYSTLSKSTLRPQLRQKLKWLGAYSDNPCDQPTLRVARPP